jgi:ribosomal protein L7Ae-like RNA K-turn-binding protein
MRDRLLGLLGIARRAGKLTFGLDASVKTVMDGQSQLILAASDASPRTILILQRVCEENNSKLIKLEYTMEQLGASIGRSSVAAVAIHGKSFTEKVKEICNTNGRKI